VPAAGPSHNEEMENLKASVIGGLAGAAVLAGLIYFYNRDANPRLEGRITEVRTLGMDQNSSVAIVNFDVVNPSNRYVIVRNHSLDVVDPKGTPQQGQIISASDVKYLFELYPALGGMGSESLVNEAEVAPEERLRRMVAARFEIPKHELDLYKEIILHIEDASGAPSEIRRESDLPEKQEQP
jgi:hypothetical protein